MYRPESLPDGYYTGRGPYISSSHHHHHPSSGYPPHARHPHSHHHTYRSRGRSPLSSIGRSSVISDDDSMYDSHSRLRWILSLGLLLPALAAVIGVVAWAVSAEVVIGARRDSALKAADAIRLSQIMNLEPESITTTSVSGFSSFPSPPSSTSGPIVAVSSTTEREPTFMPPFVSYSKEKNLQNINHDQPSTKVISSITTERIPEKMAKPKSSPTTSARESPLSNEAPVHVQDSSVKDGPKSVKKSAGDQVADVINRLVAQRRNSTGVRPHIVVVAPLKNHGKDSKSISAITTTPVSVTTTRKSTTKRPSTTRKTKATTTTEAPTTSTTTTSKPSSKKPTLTKDAETLMAAASLLAARQKYISRNDDVSMMEEVEGDEYDSEPMTIAPRNLIPFKLQESQDNRGSERQSLYQQTHFHRQPQHSSNRMGHGPNGDPPSPIALASQSMPVHVNPAIGMGPQPQGPTHQPPPNFQEHSQSSHQHIQRFPPPPHHHPHSQPPAHHPHFHPPGHGPHSSHHHPQMNGHPQQQPFFGHPPHFSNQGQPHFRPPPPPPHEQGRGGPPINFFHGPPPPFNPTGQASEINYGSPMMMRPPPPPPPTDDNTMVSSSAMTIPQPGDEEAESGKTAMISMSSGNPNNHYQPAESAPSKGLTFHFGGGPVGGGGQLVTSPVGIFKTLLLPLLPKPRVNLNGKVVFGVVLEKGVGFGKQKHPIVKLHPSHYYRHH